MLGGILSTQGAKPSGRGSRDVDHGARLRFSFSSAATQAGLHLLHEGPDA